MPTGLLDKSNMVEQLKLKVAERLAELALNPFEDARAGGLERGFINDILNGRKRSVQGANLTKLAKALSWKVENLIDGHVVDQNRYDQGEPLVSLYRNQLADTDCILIGIGDLRNVAVRALRRGDVSEKQARAAANALVATLSNHPGASVVLRLGGNSRTDPESPTPTPADR